MDVRPNKRRRVGSLKDSKTVKTKTNVSNVSNASNANKVSDASTGSAPSCDPQTHAANAVDAPEVDAEQATGVTEQQIWAVIESYFQVHHMNESKLRSYNKFVSEGLPTIIKNTSPLVVKYQNQWHVFDFKRTTMNKPVYTEGDGTSHPLYPKEARLRGQSYNADVYVHLLYSVYSMPHNHNVSVEEVRAQGKLVSSQYLPYVRVMQFPVMVKSVLCHLTDATQDYGECIFDNGGYFIVNGGEKMLMYRERLAYNKVFCYTKKEASYTHYAEFRSEHYNQFRSTNTLYLTLSKETKTEPASLYINSIPWVTYLRALGCISDREIYTRMRFVAGPRWNATYAFYVKNCLENDQGIVTQDAALMRIGKLSSASEKNRDLLRLAGSTYVRMKLLPNMGYEQRDLPSKVFALCDIACCLIDFVQNPSLKGDKDSYFNKRMESCEDLLGSLTRQLLVSYLNSIKVNILKRLEKKRSLAVHEIFADNKVSKGVADSLASGMWHATRDKVTQTGVAQKMERMNYTSTQAQHTKIINPLRKEGKQTAPRQLYSTAYGIVCPSDSPEGSTCGLVKHHAILQHQSIATDPVTITNLLKQRLKILPLDELKTEFMRQVIENKLPAVGSAAGSAGSPQSHESTGSTGSTGSGASSRMASNGAFALVRVNGRPVGIYPHGKPVADFVRQCRRELTISPDTSVSFTDTNVYIRTDVGRNMRPLFVVENLYKLKTLDARNVRWNDLLSEAIIEYVDKEEEQTLVIATDVKRLLELGIDTCTHMEVHGCVLYGVSASFIPFPNHNQAPRNTYQASMGRQAQGMHSTNAKEHRMDIQLLEMWYAQRPLVETRMHRILNCHKFPSGQNMMVAVISAGGGGQEDAQIMNLSSIQRGMQRSIQYRVVRASERRHGKMTHTEEFMCIDLARCVGVKKGDYSKIEEDGWIGVGCEVTNGTMVAQKALPLPNVSTSVPASGEGGSNGSEGGAGSAAAAAHVTPTHRDMSVGLQNTEKGIVDRVMITAGNDNLKTVMIRFANSCIPVLGDKFSTRYGQKGTLGARPRQEDMPFTRYGQTPDLIINALAFTSRMTWGEFLETLLGIVCCMNGRFGDATPFSTLYRDALYKTIEERMQYLKPGRIVDEIGDALRRLGLHPRGERTLYSGITGKRLQGRIFMGMTYVQKLKHMVADKIRARGRGRMQPLTRQPIEGRQLNGGLRFGEMERDCLESHGAAANIRDRLFLSSDLTYTHVCKICSNSVIYHEEAKKVYCTFCDKYDDDLAAVVGIPHGFNLFVQELGAIGLNVKLHVVPV